LRNLGRGINHPYRDRATAAKQGAHRLPQPKFNGGDRPPVSRAVLMAGGSWRHVEHSLISPRAAPPAQPSQRKTGLSFFWIQWLVWEVVLLFGKCLRLSLAAACWLATNTRPQAKRRVRAREQAIITRRSTKISAMQRAHAQPSRCTANKKAMQGEGKDRSCRRAVRSTAEYACPSPRRPGGRWGLPRASGAQRK